MGTVQIRPRRIFVETHMGCPHRCHHCYQVGGRLERDRALSLDDALRRIETLRSMEGAEEIRPVTGEILEHPEYLECFRAAGCTDYLLTNGMRLLRKPDLGEKIAEVGFGRIRISAHYELPGSLMPHDGHDVPDIAFAAGLSGLATEAFGLTCAINYRRVRRMFGWARQDGLVQLRLINLVPTTASLRRLVLTPEQIAEVFRQVEEIRNDPGNRATELRLLGNFGPRPGSAGEALAAENRYCPAGHESVYVTTDGSVYSCHFMLKLSSPIGRLVGDRIEVDEERLKFDRSTCPLVRNQVV